MNNVVIYTALFGTNNILVDPSVIHSDADYIAFVDRKYPECKVWKQYIVNSFSDDPVFGERRAAKIFKILPHLYLPTYSYSIWVDSTHDVIATIPELLAYLDNNDIAIWTHILRNCVYTEAYACIVLKKDYPEIIKAQMSHYMSRMYPKDNGLYEAGAILRRHSKKLNTMNAAWWEQICKFSSRDQLSLPYVLWKHNIIPKIMPGKINVLADGKTGNNELIPKVRDHLNESIISNAK